MKIVKHELAKREKVRRRKAKSRLAELGSNSEGNNWDVVSPSAEFIRNSTLAFETECENFTHGHCSSCRMSGLSIVPNRNGYCKGCAKRSAKDILMDRNSLPLWFNESGEAQYRVPPELADLTYAEKILIQRVSPFVALTHIVNGTFGIKGHVCAFEQDIDGFAMCLPRLATDTTVIKVIRSMRKEIGGDMSSVSKAYKVRKQNVLSALQFLQKHHADYRNVLICASNLDWIQGTEGYLQCVEIEEQVEPSEFDEDDAERDDNECRRIDTCDDGTEEFEERDSPDLNDDLGPSVSQTLGGADGDNICAFGYIDEGGNAPLSKEDQEINRLLRKAAADSPNAKDVAMVWPAQQNLPVDEYGETRIFVNAFPWLFPGGIGDVKDHPGSEGKANWYPTIPADIMKSKLTAFSFLQRRVGADVDLLRGRQVHERSDFWFFCPQLCRETQKFFLWSLVCRQIPKQLPERSW